MGRLCQHQPPKAMHCKVVAVSRHCSLLLVMHACRFLSFVGIAFGALFGGALPLAVMNSWFWSRIRRCEPDMQHGVHVVLKDFVVPTEIAQAVSTGEADTDPDPDLVSTKRSSRARSLASKAQSYPVAFHL